MQRHLIILEGNLRVQAVYSRLILIIYNLVRNLFGVARFTNLAFVIAHFGSKTFYLLQKQWSSVDQH